MIGCRDKLAFGEARGGNKQLAAVFGVSEFPRLVAVCNGDPSSAEVRHQKFIRQITLASKLLTM